MRESHPARRSLHPLDRLSLAALALSGTTLLLNLVWFREPDGTGATDLPFVSILVPARNEERSIERCVRSLLAQDYPAFELLVLDDGSADRTGEIVARLAAGHQVPGAGLPTGGPRLRILRGEPLPRGWGGKSWACHQLARAASGKSRYLLFTDADTVHAPGALRRAVATACRDNLGLLSLMPQQIMGSPVERMVVSLLPLQILGYLPLPAMERLSLPEMAAANGQFMLFRRELYERFGGHAARPMGLAEDVTLARLAKQYGGTVRLGNGRGLLRCRMYRGGAGVIAGFRRSFSAGFRLAPLVTTMILLLNGIAYLLPFLRMPASRTARLLGVAVLLLRTTLAWRTATPLPAALAHPPGMLLLLGCQLLAAYDACIARHAKWKGRTYSLNGRALFPDEGGHDDPLPTTDARK